MLWASHVAESLRDSEEPQLRGRVSLGEAELRAGIQRELSLFVPFVPFVPFRGPLFVAAISWPPFLEPPSSYSAALRGWAFRKSRSQADGQDDEPAPSQGDPDEF